MCLCDKKIDFPRQKQTQEHRTQSAMDSAVTIQVDEFKHIHRAGEVCCVESGFRRGVILNQYSHVFSPFEHDTMGSLAFSKDFIHQVYQQVSEAHKHREEERALILLVPTHKRNRQTEADIKTRLEMHLLRKHGREQFEVYQKHIALSILALLVATIFFVVAIALNWYKADNSLIWTFAVNIANPVSSYSMWDSLTTLFALWKKRDQKRLYHTLESITVEFHGLCLYCANHSLSSRPSTTI